MILNPIIPGFAPDPSVTRIGDTYFIAVSTFHLFPGIPIFASKDLASWEHIGNAINRPGQVRLAQSSTRLKQPDSDEVVDQLVLATGGLYAPTIRYRDGMVYVICTNFIHDGPEDFRLENFIVSSTDIWSDTWSDPVYFEFHGIDPDLFWDDDGRAYVVGSAWGDCTTISCLEINVDTGAILTPQRDIWAGHTKVIPEGPHLYKRDGYYYLLVSEGGTAEHHCLVVARSHSVWGPYTSCDKNPILKEAPDGMFAQHTGHGDIFEDAHVPGRWWMACLGVRKSQSRFHMGRESFLTTVRWEPGCWPEINPVQRVADFAHPEKAPTPGPHLFTAANPFVDLVYIRDPDLSSFSKATNARDIDIRASAADLSDPESPISFIGKRQRRLDGEASVRLLLNAPESGINAGLGIYKDEHRHATISWDGAISAVRFYMVNRAKYLETSQTFPMKDKPASITFRLEYTVDTLRWYFRGDGENEEVCAEALDTASLTGHCFVGPVVGLFAVGQSEGDTLARFRDFEVDRLRRAIAD